MRWDFVHIELLGSWKLERSIHDIKTKKMLSSMLGKAEFISSNDNRLFYQENVKHHLVQKNSLDATRYYIYLATQNNLKIYFTSSKSQILTEDSKLFVALEFNGNKQAKAFHKCLQDQYDVTFNCIDKEHFEFICKVMGPKKSYQIKSHFYK